MRLLTITMTHKTTMGEISLVEMAIRAPDGAKKYNTAILYF